jgi:hypothetical protein
VQFEIRGDSAIAVDVYQGRFGFEALAFANNQNGGTGPTLFSSMSNGLNTLSYYDNGNWMPIPGSAPVPLDNGGGNGNFLYFMGYNTIVRHIDTSFTMIYHDTLLAAQAIAVDDSGYVWLAGSYIGAVNQTMHYILEISPIGQVVKQYPVEPFNSYNGLGAFIQNGTFYLALGQENVLHPHSLIPITIGQDTAIVGTPIWMPANYYLDLASCGSATTLGVKNISQAENPSGLDLYPNPAIDRVTIAVDQVLTGSTATILDITGRIVSEAKLIDRNTTIDLRTFSKGVYLITASDSHGLKQTKRLVINR